MKSILLAFLSLIPFSLLAQQEMYEALWREEAKEGFDHLPKGTLRKEIACFSSFGESEKNNSIKPGKTSVISSEKNQMTFKRENITVTIRRKSFDKSKYKIKKDENGYVAAINGKHLFGVDGGMPSTAIQSVQVIIDKDTLRLPPTAYTNLFEPSFCGVQVVEEGQWGCPQIYISADKKRIYIFSTHSDAAGAYEVTWVIQDKKYLRRVVDGGY